MSDEDAVNEELAAQEQDGEAWDYAPTSWLLVAYVAALTAIGALCVLAAETGEDRYVWGIAGLIAAVGVGYAWVFGTHRKDGAQ